MRHLSSIKDDPAPKSLHIKATGRFYTPEAIGRPLAKELAGLIASTDAPLVVVDPFCGDGRLVAWFMEEAARRDIRTSRLLVRLWDIDPAAVAEAQKRVRAVASALNVHADVEAFVGDSFAKGSTARDDADVLITNPPWERLKPDRREHDGLRPDASERYVAELRAYDRQLSEWFPLSRPVKKFSGWGTNLSRVGTEMSLRLIKMGGVAGVVSPPSLLGDQDSLPLRRHLLTEYRLEALSYFPAEARLFEGVDQPAITFVAVRQCPPSDGWVRTTVFDADGRRGRTGGFALHPSRLEQSGYYLPTGFGVEAADLIVRFEENPTFASLESPGPHGLWAGREIDETSYESFLRPTGNNLFVKGRMIERWAVREIPSQYVDPSLRRIPPSTAHPRVAWRDVSRPNQKRRVQASLIPAGWVAGNSLSVAHFRDDSLPRLSGLLALLNSLVFEFQVRARLSTGHVSLGTVRQVGVPESLFERSGVELAALATRRLAGDTEAEHLIEVRIAQLYGLDLADFERLVRCFPKITPEESGSLLESWRRVTHLDLSKAG